MFAQNERISTRQFTRLLTLELFGVTTVLLPGILCETVRRDGLTALFGGLLLVLLYAWLLKDIGRYAGRSLQLTLKAKSRVLYDIFLFIMLIQMILMGVWVLTLVAELSKDILLQGTDIRIIILTFAAVSAIGAFKGMECRGRMAEVLYLFLLLPFLVLLILAARKVDMDYMPPVFTEPVKKIANGSYEVFIVFQGVTLGFFALPYLKNQKQFWQGIRGSILINGLFCLLLLVVSIGIFGATGAAGQKWLAVNLMTTPHFPGGIAERLDVLMVTIWIVSLFFFVSGSIFYSGKMAGRLFRMKHTGSGLIITAFLIITGSMLVGNREYAYYTYMNYMKYIGVPLLLILFLIILLRVKPKKVIAIAASVVLLLSLTGCAKGVELEDRDFVLALGVEWDGEKISYYYDTSTGGADGYITQQVVEIQTEQFYELQSAYGQQSDHYLDYNHLKAVIIGSQLASSREKLIELLQYIEANELFARNVKLFLAQEDMDSIFKLCQNMDTVLGEYLDNMYIDSNYYVEGQSATLGDLLSHWHEEEETLLVPLLKAQENSPAVSGYAFIQNVQKAGSVDNKTANLIFLGNGVDIRAEVNVSDTYAVELNHVSRELSYQNADPPQVTIRLRLRGTIENQEVKTEKQKIELANALEDQIKKDYETILPNWQNLDVLHLYRALGSHDRELWREYKDDRQAFIQNVKIIVEPDCKIM